MQRFKLNKKTIFYCICYAVVILNLGLVIPFQLKRLVTLRSKIGDLEKKTGKFKIDLVSQPTLLAQKNQIRYVEIPEMKSKIISSQDIFTVSAYISKRAKENNIEVLEIVPQNVIDYKTISGGAYFLRPIRVKANARFHDLASFLNDLDNSEYFLETKKIKIRQAEFTNDIIMTIYALQEG